MEILTRFGNGNLNRNGNGTRNSNRSHWPRPTALEIETEMQIRIRIRIRIRIEVRIAADGRSQRHSNWLCSSAGESWVVRDSVPGLGPRPPTRTRGCTRIGVARSRSFQPLLSIPVAARHPSSAGSAVPWGERRPCARPARTGPLEGPNFPSGERGLGPHRASRAGQNRDS